MSDKNTHILFVCTGNTCRSPMAEYLLKKHLGDQSHISISSAGIMAGDGYPASDTGVKALKEKEIDSSTHRSRFLTPDMIDEATMVVVMTAHHKQILDDVFPESGEKTVLLKSFIESAENLDVPDPVGGSLDLYRHTRDIIESAIVNLILTLKEKGRL